MNPRKSRKSSSMRRASLALALVAASVLTTALASPSFAAPVRTTSSAQAADARVEQQIQDVLRQNEGAERVAKDRIRLEPGVELTVASSTRAAAGIGDCRPGYACVWQHSNFTGNRLDFYYYRSYELAGYPMPGGGTWQDQISSFFNNQTGGAWMVGRNWLTEGGSSGWEWIFGGPGAYREAQVSANDQADLIELYA